MSKCVCVCVCACVWRPSLLRLSCKLLLSHCRMWRWLHYTVKKKEKSSFLMRKCKYGRHCFIIKWNMSHSLFKKIQTSVFCFYFKKISDLKKQATLTSPISCTQIKQNICCFFLFCIVFYFFVILPSFLLLISSLCTSTQQSKKQRITVQISSNPLYINKSLKINSVLASDPGVYSSRGSAHGCFL